MTSGVDLTGFLAKHQGTAPYQRCGLRLVGYGDGKARMECPIDAATQNVNGTLHGGIIGLIVDEAGTVALACVDREGRPGVTTDLSIAYLNPGRPPHVVAEARTLKIGKTLGVVHVDIFNLDGSLVASGRMTKYMPALK